MNTARRKALGEIQDQLTDLQSALELFKDEEQECYDNLPEGIQYSEKGEAMESAVESMEAAYDNIQDAIDNISEAIEA
jgi:uncharacterized protein YukE